MFSLCERRLASPPAKAEVIKMPTVAEVSINPVSIAVKFLSVWKNYEPAKKVP
jgi:hypothetical protein